jgi:hypothetical protein
VIGTSTNDSRPVPGDLTQVPHEDTRPRKSTRSRSLRNPANMAAIVLALGKVLTFVRTPRPVRGTSSLTVLGIRADGAPLAIPPGGPCTQFTGIAESVPAHTSSPPSTRRARRSAFRGPRGQIATRPTRSTAFPDDTETRCKAKTVSVARVIRSSCTAELRIRALSPSRFGAVSSDSLLAAGSHGLR